jgi:hypothetical protein
MAITNTLTGFYALNKIGLKTFETNFSNIKAKMAIQAI